MTRWLGVAVALIVAVAGAAGATPAASPTPVPEAVVVPSGSGLSSPASAELKALVASGKLADLGYPDFSDNQSPVASFYQAGAYGPAWTAAGVPTSQALALIKLFESAATKGLNPADYDGPRWDARLKALNASKPAPADAVARFDLAMTICAMRYIAHLHNGRLNPAHYEFSYDQGQEKLDLAQFLRERVIIAPSINDVIAEAEPPFMGYARAEAALAAYVELAGEGDGPPLAMPAKSIRPGDSYAKLAALGARLRQLGDWPANEPAAADSGKYDGVTVEAVKHFQIRHGLAPDGVLGKGTIDAINVPLSHRAEQLELTLERYRWIPPKFPQPPIVVNIPEFRLRTMRAQSAGFLSMEVVVGKAYQSETPVFAGEMQYVIFRPYWNVPLSIQMRELVPKIRKDPGYLAANNYEVVDGSEQVITDGTISEDVLSQLRAGELFIRQKPGPKNALGLVKFIFPNSYNVYLHSTPSPELFGRARRDFSHGCIRVQDPEALAVWVLRDKPGWDAAKVHAAMYGSDTVQVNLDHPIPVLILYSTAVVEPDGETRFFGDIYGNDAKLEKALAEGFPYKTAVQLNTVAGSGD
ncbi:MAG: L,D-transpeptidase family protein [Candidatus Binataceae bacterium]